MALFYFIFFSCTFSFASVCRWVGLRSLVSFNWLNVFFFLFIVFVCICDFLLSLPSSIPYLGQRNFWHDELLAIFMWNFNYLLIYKLCFPKSLSVCSESLPFVRNTQNAWSLWKTFTLISIFFRCFDPKNLSSKQDFHTEMDTLTKYKIEHVQDGFHQRSTYMNLLCIISPKCIRVPSKMNMSDKYFHICMYLFR